MNSTRNETIDSRKAHECKLFREIYDATLKYYNLTAENAPHSAGSKKRWTDLAHIWYVQADNLNECSALDCALHAIYWGRPMSNIPEGLSELSEMVKDVILNEEHIAAALRSDLTFYHSFYRTINQAGVHSKCPYVQYSRLFNKYREKHLWYRVIYRQANVVPVNFETATWRDIKTAKSHAGVRGFCVAFETAIRFLLPEAECWSEDQWLDEEFLHSRLHAAFGKDWRRDPFALDDLITMLMDKLYFKDPKYLARLLSIKRLPASVIKHIWPKDTFLQLEELFYTAMVRSKAGERKMRNDTSYHCRYSYANLKQSWLYAFMVKHRKKISNDKVRRELMLVGMEVA